MYLCLSSTAHTLGMVAIASGIVGLVCFFEDMALLLYGYAVEHSHEVSPPCGSLREEQFSWKHV